MQIADIHGILLEAKKKEVERIMRKQLTTKIQGVEEDMQRHGFSWRVSKDGKVRAFDDVKGEWVTVDDGGVPTEENLLRAGAMEVNNA